MQVTTSITLTVLHDGQFWIGIFEHADEGRYGACRVVFGAAEPTEARKLVERAGVGTKAQQAMSVSYEARKIESRALAREARQAQAERRFALRRQKRKQKHLGR